MNEGKKHKWGFSAIIRNIGKLSTATLTLVRCPGFGRLRLKENKERKFMKVDIKIEEQLSPLTQIKSLNQVENILA